MPMKGGTSRKKKHASLSAYYTQQKSSKETHKLAKIVMNKHVFLVNFSRDTSTATNTNQVLKKKKSHYLKLSEINLNNFQTRCIKSTKNTHFH